MDYHHVTLAMCHPEIRETIEGLEKNFDYTHHKGGGWSLLNRERGELNMKVKYIIHISFGKSLRGIAAWEYFF